MTGPRIGEQSTEWQPVCGYSDAPGRPKCQQPATRHLMLWSPHSGLVSVSTCDQHLPIARMAGELRQEHPYRDCCGMPGTYWNIELNRCVIDDSGVEPQLEGRELAHA